MLWRFSRGIGQPISKHNLLKIEHLCVEFDGFFILLEDLDEPGETNISL